MHLLSDLTLGFQLDQSDDPGDVIDALILSRFLDGSEPWARTVRVSRVRADADLVPGRVLHERMALAPGRDASLVRGAGWSLRAVRWRDGSAVFTVTACDEATGGAVLAVVTAAAAVPDEPDDSGFVAVGFWHLGRHGAHRQERRLAVLPWPNIRGNYNRSVAAALDRLIALTPSDLSGRLVLLHGPPGTGKTSAFRCLAHEWRPWCQVDYVLDPERLLGDPGYLISAALNDDDQHGRWRLLILEDCDELIRADAKRGAGQSLGRLLNLTDGLLGQGTELLVAITTNEPLASLHPAVTRPGRCVAEIEVGVLDQREARAWLGDDAGIDRIGESGATLAELYAVRGRVAVIEEARPAVPVGTYL
ncbi:MAG: DUF5925 domain-containing protein [Acidimicrobiales bacterium]